MIEVLAIENEGDWFVIPKSKKQEWDLLINRLEITPENSDKYYIVCDEFENTFGDYRTGGDLNLVQLYAELDLTLQNSNTFLLSNA